MRRLTLVPLALLAAPALAADAPQPGLWKVTVKSLNNDTVIMERADNRCLKPEQLSAIEKSFVPEQGAACTRTAFEWTGKRLSWRIACTEPVKMDNSGWYEFDAPTHYTGELTVRIVIPNGSETLARTQIEGQRVGDCPP